MKPLQHPKKQIRLLNILPGASEDQICTDIRTFDIQHAPSYLAISYAWGNLDNLRVILIDGQRHNVRTNCHYALWQARLHYTGSWIWVDSLCIKQDDLREKGHQVKLMGNIYASAKLVLACIGSDTKDVQAILTFAPELVSCNLDADTIADHIHVKGRATGTTSEMTPAIVTTRNFLQRMVPSRTYTPSIAEDFKRACRSFARRPYWERLWIVQELALSREKVIMCGSQVHSWRLVSNLLLCNSYLRGPSVLLNTNEPLLVVDSVINGGGSRSLLRSLESLQCYDARDRIYGTMGFIDWHYKGQSIYPDYKRSAVKLAKMVAEMPSLANEDHEDLYRMLGVYDVMKNAANQQQQQRQLDAVERKSVMRQRDSLGLRLSPVDSRACPPDSGRRRAFGWLTEYVSNHPRLGRRTRERRLQRAMETLFEPTE